MCENQKFTTGVIENTYILKKFPGKGGWTYAEIDEIAPDRHAWFNWVRVKGTIDGFEFKNTNLMPIGNGKLMLPLNAMWRKKIAKGEGDWVTICFQKDDSPVEIPDELRQCLENEPDALKKFHQLNDGKKKEYIDWVYSAKNEDIRIKRIVSVIEKALKF